MAQGPSVSDTFVISNNFENQEAIKVINEGNSQGETRMIAVNVWHPQGRTNGDEDVSPLNAEAVFFGQTARIIEENFSPGDQIRLSGELKVTVENGYADVRIQHASFRFPAPSPGGNSGGNGSGNQEEMSSSSAEESYGGGVPESQKAEAPRGGDGAPASNAAPAGNSTESADTPKQMPQSL